MELQRIYNNVYSIHFYWTTNLWSSLYVNSARWPTFLISAFDRQPDKFEGKWMWNGLRILVNNHTSTQRHHLASEGCRKFPMEHSMRPFQKKITGQARLGKSLLRHECLNAAKPFHVQWGLHLVCEMVLHPASLHQLCAAQRNSSFWKLGSVMLEMTQANKTLPHVLNHCKPHLITLTHCHNAVLKRFVKAFMPQNGTNVQVN
jgi:hypothetical protein